MVPTLTKSCALSQFSNFRFKLANFFLMSCPGLISFLLRHVRCADQRECVNFLYTGLG